MEIGAAIFFTEYSMAPTDLALALEQRGSAELWSSTRTSRSLMHFSAARLLREERMRRPSEAPNTH